MKSKQSNTIWNRNKVTPDETETKWQPYEIETK